MHLEVFKPLLRTGVMLNIKREWVDGISAPTQARAERGHASRAHISDYNQHGRDWNNLAQYEKQAIQDRLSMNGSLLCMQSGFGT